ASAACCSMRSINAIMRWYRGVCSSSPHSSWQPTRWSTCSMASSIHVFVTPRSTVPQQRRFDGLPRRLIGNQAAAIGLAIVLVYMLLALMADLLPLRNPLQIVAVNRLAGPNWSLPLGADTFGRDLLSRLVYGARLSLEVAVVSVALALFAGC